MKLPLLTRVTRAVSPGHHTTEARTEGGKLVFGFRGWLVEACVEFQPRDLWVGAFWKRDKRSAATVHVYVCPLPTLALHLECTDFG